MMSIQIATKTIAEMISRTGTVDLIATSTISSEPASLYENG
jgi:hypothetical protein